MNSITHKSIEAVQESSKAEFLAFLRQHEDYSLFLLGNYEAHGCALTTSPNSGNYKLIRSNGKIVAVFSLTRRGSLLIQSISAPQDIVELILSACKEETMPITGLLGEWNFCQQLWNLLKEKKVIRQEALISKEILYSLPLLTPPSQQPFVRLLMADDYVQWKPLRLDFLREVRLPNNISEQQMQDVYLEKVTEKIAWGYFLEGKLVSVADLNAKAIDLGQVGGVYTHPGYRQRGFSKAVMQQIIRDARLIHHIRKLIIYTGETNHVARRLYESLGVQPVGHFALLFGS